MAQMTSGQAIELALQHQNAGRLQEAQSIYRQILAADPRHSDALHLLGVLHFQAGQLEPAQDLVRRAIAIVQNNPQYHGNLGQILSVAGKHDEAIAAFRHAIQLNPEYAEALNNLGSTFQTVGRFDEAIDTFRRAIVLRPNVPQLYFNLANALQSFGDLGKAVIEYRRAISLNPAFSEAHQNMGNAFMAAGQPADALVAFQRVLELRPDAPDALLNTAMALRATGQVMQAIPLLQQAIQRLPGFPQAYLELGNALYQLGRYTDAIFAYRQVMAQRPESADASYNLGTALQANNQIKDAIAAYRRAISLQPDHFMAWVNLSGALYADRQLIEAAAAGEKALALQPQRHEPHLNLANALCGAGRVREAINSLRTALGRQPNWALAHSNLAYFMSFDPNITADEIAAEHKLWNQRHAAPLATQTRPHEIDRFPDRRLRIGYVSADFRQHSVAYFIEPLLAGHNPEQVEVFCYSSVACPDDVTASLRKLVPQWHDISLKSDEQTAALIREHRIDILVDLAGHTADGRLLVFARNPAPVQVTYLGYPNTTGLDAIDYLMTDAFADPPGAGDKHYSEKRIRLPHCFACFRPDARAPQVNDLPAATNGFVTFASTNILPKVNDVVLETWARILKAVPDSRLIMTAPGLHEHAITQRIREKLNSLGVGNDRVSFNGYLPTTQYLAMHNKFDIHLDTFPVNGHTTTCHAIWMGVPVITLAGRSHASRLGCSVLSNLGLESFIASSTDQYVEIATKVANDLPRLLELRTNLRRRMSESPLTNASVFAAAVENAYRTMWRQP